MFLSVSKIEKNINVLILLIDKFYEDNSYIRWFLPSFYIDLFFIGKGFKSTVNFYNFFY